MTQALTWTPDFSNYAGMSQVGGDAHACSSSRSPFNFAASSINTQFQSPKRKRSDAREHAAKRQKFECWPGSPDVNLDVRVRTAAPYPCAGEPQISPPVNGAPLPHGQRTSTGSCEAPYDKAAGEIAQRDPAAISARDTAMAIKSESVTTEHTVEHDQHARQVAPAISPLPDGPPAKTPEIHGTTASIDTHPPSEITMKNRIIDRIDANICLKTLEKHNELRLIEAEIGKAQIALEQLRRVKIIPFPEVTRSPTTIDNVVTGKGPTLEPEPGLGRPKHPTPFGVADGPYARHYARWLIPDETFDPSPPSRLSRISTALSPVSGPGRKRASLEEQTPVRAPKRSSTNQIPQLPTVTISIDGSPLLVVQRDDSEWVKVVCRICGKRNAANLQGFTNHTRIAHSITYPNHKEAIKDCGQQLDEHESAQVSATVALQRSSTSQPAADSTPLRAAKPVVQTLVQHSSAGQSKSGQHALNKFHSQDWRHSQPATSKIEAPARSKQAAGGGFVSSQDTPYLSQKLAKQGCNIDLRHLVTSSKLRVDLDQVQSLAPESNEEASAPVTATASSRTQGGVAHAGSRMPARASTAPEESALGPQVGLAPSILPAPGSIQDAGQFVSSAPAHSRPNAIPDSFSLEASPTLTSSFGHDHDMVENSVATSPIIPGTHSDDLSPTTEPGLVSDHDDDSDCSHSPEHFYDAEDVEGNSLTHVRVRGEHGDEDEDMQSYQHVGHVQDQGHCATAPPFADSAFFSDHQTTVGARQQAYHPTASTIATPSSQKKKRGRPRKNEKPPSTN